MFSNLRQGSQIYILEKGEKAPSLIEGIVSSVSAPRPKFITQTPGINLGMNTETVVDVKAKSGEQDYDFKDLPVNLCIANFGGVVVCESREAMLQEIDARDAESKQVIESAPYHEAARLHYEQFRRRLNPSYEKEKERDDAILKLNDEVNGMKGNIDKILSILSKNGGMV